MVTAKNNLVMSKIDRELEKDRKEKEDLAKELEKAENEAATTEMKRQITFLRSTQYQTNSATRGPGMSSGDTAQTTNIPSTTALGTSSSFAKQNVVGNTSNTSNQHNIGASSSQGFQKKPIFMERYR